MSSPLPRLALTTGEPAGIGPDLTVQPAQQASAAIIVAIGDPELLAERAAVLQLPLKVLEYDPASSEPATSGELYVSPVPLNVKCLPGQPDPENAGYVLATLDQAINGCMDGSYDAMVTAPLHKGVMNDAGIRFSGHTEYLAENCGVATPVMLLVAEQLRVALATTHLPLAAVPAAITSECIGTTASVLDADLKRLFGLDKPRIALLGLNPHAGEGGHLGQEELTIIQPTAAKLRDRGIDISDPLPADSAFTQEQLKNFDAVLAMYHDQGLPVLKHAGFGNAVNVTLGLPIVRTSVDHGTALELAATGKADDGSLRSALALAVKLAAARAT